MKRIVAVRLDDVPEGFLLTVYAPREKNRQRIHAEKVTFADKGNIPGIVEEVERKFRGNDKPQGELT